uniref:Uncharacterized protein n=1 Tax=Romanomermis culicivorax TaxID=13658 RepID=A0A915HXA8_ROMCU
MVRAADGSDCNRHLPLLFEAYRLLWGETFFSTTQGPILSSSSSSSNTEFADSDLTFFDEAVCSFVSSDIVPVDEPPPQTPLIDSLLAAKNRLICIFFLNVSAGVERLKPKPDQQSFGVRAPTGFSCMATKKFMQGQFIRGCL